MAREPSTKGTSVLPLALALQNLPNARDLVPQRLWKYLDDHILVSAWYPEREVLALIEILASALPPEQVGGDPWHFFGVVAAQRDLGGSQEQVPEENRTGVQGVYRNYARGGAEDLELFIKRALKLWSQYHDTGVMEIRGGRVATNAFVVRLVGFQIPLEGYVRLQVAYTEEYGRLAGVPMHGKILRSTAKGDPFCEWEYALDRTPASEAFVRSLSPLP